MPIDFGSFLGGAADAGSADIVERRTDALQYKMKSRLIEDELNAQERLYDYKKFSPETTALIGTDAGKERGLGNIFGPGQQISSEEGNWYGGLDKARMSASTGRRGSATISGKEIKSLLPAGSVDSLEDNKQYPMAMATFASSAARMGMGTADMRNQLAAIGSFDKSVQDLQNKYDAFSPSNPLLKTIEEKWAAITKGWTTDKSSTKAGSLAENGTPDELIAGIYRNADNAEVADMLAQRVSLAIEYARATQGARASDKDFTNALLVIPAYSGDVKLRNLRFSALRKMSSNKMSGLAPLAPVSSRAIEAANKKAAESKKALLPTIDEIDAHLANLGLDPATGRPRKEAK